jgi:hypothetical protein
VGVVGHMVLLSRGHTTLRPRRRRAMMNEVVIAACIVGASVALWWAFCERMMR